MESFWVFLKIYLIIKVKNEHELVLFYDAYIDNKDYQEKYKVIDDDSETEAIWIDIDRFKNKELVLYPEQIFKYLF